MKHSVQYIDGDLWQYYQRSLKDEADRNKGRTQLREMIYKIEAESYRNATGEELTRSQFDCLHPDPYRDDHPELDDYPPSSTQRFRSRRAALDFAFVKRLEGCKVRIFAHPGVDECGDELWEEL